jgi:hypothetical protein
LLKRIQNHKNLCKRILCFFIPLCIKNHALCCSVTIKTHRRRICALHFTQQPESIYTFQQLPSMMISIRNIQRLQQTYKQVV